MPRYGLPPDVEAALPRFLSAWGIEPTAISEIEEGYERVRHLTAEEQAVLTPTLLLACLSDAIRTISGRIRSSRAFETAEECHMYCRYRKLRDASRAGSRGA
jgi:Ser/Thr protein kinase RdoA (MazF antagonist)